MGRVETEFLRICQLWDLGYVTCFLRLFNPLLKNNKTLWSLLDKDEDAKWSVVSARQSAEGYDFHLLNASPDIVLLPTKVTRKPLRALDRSPVAMTLCTMIPVRLSSDLCDREWASPSAVEALRRIQWRTCLTLKNPS